MCGTELSVERQRDWGDRWLPDHACLFSKCTALWNFQLRQQLSSSQRENEKHQIQQVQEKGIKAKESKGTKKNLYKLK